MPKSDIEIFDGCTAAAHVAYANSDTAFIYPITPSSAMAELADLWAAQGRKNIFDQVTGIRQMQSEAGAAGAVHGSLVVGCLTTTFTASQGLLLMVPNMYKIAGELTPCVFHVSARAVATQALSIFGDHSDVMAVRQCGWAILASSTVQEAMDLAQIAHMATLKCRVPFIHFFDGFRTSHELQKIHVLDNPTMKSLLDHDKITEMRQRALNPTTPSLIGTSQGPEVYFQNVEVANIYYQKVGEIVKDQMALFGQVVGRHYELYSYYGDPDATDVIIIMGAGYPVCKEVVDYYSNQNQSKSIGDQFKVGVVVIHLFRPWCLDDFIAKVPQSTRRVSVLDRTKESGALGEPLYLDVAASFQVAKRRDILVFGGRYGLGSKDFTPAMVFAIYENMRSSNPKEKFTVGIEDDITNLSLPYKLHQSINTVPAQTTECMFWGFGSDGTVGANKNVIKIIGDNTPLNVQGYFAYSAHKAGGLTVSHLRFGPKPITSQYLIQQADYVACHRSAYVETFDMVNSVKPNGVFVLNCPWSDSELEHHLPAKMRRDIARLHARFYTIDANDVAQKTNMGRRINNILMTLFFRLSGILPFEEAISLFKNVIAKTYGKKGQHVVEANWKAVDATLNLCHEVVYDREAWLEAKDLATTGIKKPIHKKALEKAPEFVNSVLLPLERLEGNELPTSVFQSYVGGRLPMGIAAYEKRGIALNIPIVNMELCTQCNYCAFVCPHAAIRPFLLDDDEAEQLPSGFVAKKAKGTPEIASYKYAIQVSPLDCTGCELCSIACPAKCLTMTPLPEVKDREIEKWNFATALPSREDLCGAQRTTIKGSQFYTPLMEFSGACEGCGETPYVKLLTQLFGERMIIANATGCSSIWGASYPCNPYTKNEKGFGPAWGNSLFEDNAEYGYGMVIASEQRRERFHTMMSKFVQIVDDAADASIQKQDVDPVLYEGCKQFVQHWKDDPMLCQQLYEKLTPLLEQAQHKHPILSYLYKERSMFPKFSHWIVGGDGWAYDIGYGGLDHVIASGININILILDTEVYSNTGGQKSKSTPLGAVHKFSASGNMKNKKDLGLICMQYGNVYVGSVASSANFAQTIRTFVEAEKFHGPSVILAYAPCIEHGYIKPFSAQITHCTMAVDSGYWPLYRYNPDLLKQGLSPLQLDSKKIKLDLKIMLDRENRFAQLQRADPALCKILEDELCHWVKQRFNLLKAKADGFDLMALGDQVQQTGDKATDGVRRIHILYGSETGNAEEVATRMASMIRLRDLKASVLSLSDIDVDDLADMQTIIVVCSTAGQGEFPVNAKSFYETLNQPDLLNAEDKLLKHARYGVFGLGDSSYIFFNEAAKKLDTLFEQLGGTRLVPCGMGDDQDEDKYDSALCEWLPVFWKEAEVPEPLNESEDPAPSMYRVELLSKEDPSQPTQACVPLGSTLLRLCVNSRLTPDDYEVEIRHLEFDLTGTQLRYALGDSLAIYPHTDPTLVQQFCAYFNLDPTQRLRIARQTDETSAKHDALFKDVLTVHQLLTECLDISAKPNRRFYEILYKYCTDPSEKAQAKSLLDNKELLNQYQKQEYVNCFDLIRKYKSITKDSLTLDRLIDLIPLHKPRYYSIASSQKFVGLNQLDLCVGIVEWTTSHQEKRFGCCTGYLRRLIAQNENCPFFVAASIKPTAFNMPPDDTYPIIVAGMGTGLAPFRSFIQHRAYLKRQGKQIGPVVVYFGCRYSKKDYLYGEELEAYAKEGVITELKVAFSRDQKHKFYVQHHIEKDPALLYKRLVLEKGYFYLCGSAKQVPIDIRKAVVEAISSQQNVPLQEADKIVTDMQIKGQYNVEAW